MICLIKVANLNFFELSRVASACPLNYGLNGYIAIEVWRKTVSTSGNRRHCQGLCIKIPGCVQNIEKAAFEASNHEFFVVSMLVPIWSDNMNNVLSLL